MSKSTDKKKEKTALLDGLATDLFNRVEKPIEYHKLSSAEHMDSITAIHRILSQIQKHEKGRLSTAAPVDAATRMQFLQEWFDQNNVKIDGIKFDGSLPEGPGVVATRDFNEGDLVASLPSELMMTHLTAVQTKDVGLIHSTDAWFRAVPSLILAMHLLFEKHRPAVAPSRWLGYIKSLPGQHCLSEFNQDASPDDIILPLAFSLETASLLQGTTALPEYHRMLRTVAKQYCHMRTVLRQLGVISAPLKTATREWFCWAEFRWAVSMVMMRQTQVPVSAEALEAAVSKNPSAAAAGVAGTPAEAAATAAAIAAAESASAAAAAAAASGDDTTAADAAGGAADTSAAPAADAASTSAAAAAAAAPVRQVMALVPVIDMFNHEEGPITSTFGTDSNVMEVSAKRSFKAGEQVYLSYGYRPNTIMLLYSGFIPGSNERDRFRIPLELPPSDPLYNKKLALLKWLELPPSTHLDLYWSGKPSPELATWLRVATTSDEGQITEDLRGAIAARAKETAELLEAHGKDKDFQPATANGRAETTSKPASSADVTLSKAQADLLSSICQQKLQELQAGAAAGDDKAAGSKAAMPAGLGLGGGLEARSAGSKGCEKEQQLVRQLREAEEGALKKALEMCAQASS
ncbi:hypothetical protein CLOM_g13412 [Closterium sp. NIES-68]|nr:hypothetical protein CLOM_g13412 [Closterium sp. NIES-68]GJP72425.1 hypothetical protein CLOP_g3160 [Closterium sp. NIES-67]